MRSKRAIIARLTAILSVGLFTAFLFAINASAQPPGLVYATGCPTGAVLSTDQFTTTGIPSSLTVSPNSQAVAGAWVLVNDYVASTGVAAGGHCPAPPTPSFWPLNVMGFLITTTITNAHDADVQEIDIYQDTNGNGRYDPGIDLQMAIKTGADLDAGRAMVYNGGASPVFVLGSTMGGTCKGVANLNVCAVAILAVVKIGPNPISGSDFALQLEAYAGDIPGALPGGPAPGSSVSNSFGASANPQGSNIDLHIIGGSSGGGGGAPPSPPGGGLSLSAHAGWNMISSPVGSVPLSSLQGNCSIIGGPWWWDGSQYQQPSMIDPGKGYWVKVATGCTMQASGSNSSQSLSLFGGWNMISSSGSWNAMNTGGCSLLGGPYWYDGTQYQSVDPNTPMNDFLGYWVKIGGSCSVTSQDVRRGERPFAPTADDSMMPPGPPMESAPLALQSLRLTTAQAGRIELQLIGSGIAASELRLYSLSGDLIAQARGTGNTLRVAAFTRDGRPLANGVYLYIVTVRSTDGQTIVSDVKKLVVMR